MLSAERIKAVEELLRVNFADFTAAINDEKEVEFELPELTGYTKEEVEALKKNVADQNYGNGLKTGSETVVKDAKKKYGVDFEGKDMDLFIDAFKKKVISENSMEPNKKIQELESVNAGLKASLSKAESEKDELVKSHHKLNLRTNALNSIKKEYNLPKSDMLTLMMASGYDIEDDNGKIVTKKHGETVRDSKTHDPMPFDVVFEEFAKEKGQIKPDAAVTTPPVVGRGEKSTKTSPAAYATCKEFEAAWLAQGKSTNSAEFAAKATEYAKGNPDFFSN